MNKFVISLLLFFTFLSMYGAYDEQEEEKQDGAMHVVEKQSYFVDVNKKQFGAHVQAKTSMVVLQRIKTLQPTGLIISQKELEELVLSLCALCQKSGYSLEDVQRNKINDDIRFAAWMHRAIRLELKGRGFNFKIVQ